MVVQKQRVIDFARLVTKAPDSEFASRLGEHLDLEGTARYLAVTVFLSDMDGLLGPGQNYYLYLDPRTQKFSFIAWDQDHSFGQFFLGTQAAREQLSIHHPWSESSLFLERLFAVPAFKQLYMARLTEFTATIFKPERFHRQVDELALALRPAVKDESAQRLLRFERAVAGEVPPGDAGMFRGANIPIKPFVKARAVGGRPARRAVQRAADCRSILGTGRQPITHGARPRQDEIARRWPRKPWPATFSRFHQQPPARSHRTSRTPPAPATASRTGRAIDRQ